MILKDEIDAGSNDPFNSSRPLEKLYIFSTPNVQQMDWIDLRNESEFRNDKNL